MLATITAINTRIEECLSPEAIDALLISPATTPTRKQLKMTHTMNVVLIALVMKRYVFGTKTG